jgi:hypothetical protein
MSDPRRQRRRGWRWRLLLGAGLLAGACDGSPTVTDDDAGGGDPPPADAATGDASPADATDAEPCPLGAACNPIPITALPFRDDRDTGAAPSDAVDAYACAPATSEAGPELFFAATVPSRGLLVARVSDGAGVDVDLHLLTGTDPETCRARNDLGLGRLVDAGTVILVADTWCDGSTCFPGAFTLEVGFVPLAGGPCALDELDVSMFWPACDGELDCDESGSEVLLRTPAYGPVVQEAHLVTVDDGFGAAWPASISDGIAGHYDVSEAATCFDITRSDVWAPEEGGSHFGQAAYGAKLPTVDESWYVNMYWRARPVAGRRMLVLDPFTGLAVVGAGGYETGPGANTAVGGAVEEIHRYLGTSHRDALVLGFAANDALPFGPIDCSTGTSIDLCP